MPKDICASLRVSQEQVLYPPSGLEISSIDHKTIVYGMASYRKKA